MHQSIRPKYYVLLQQAIPMPTINDITFLIPSLESHHHTITCMCRSCIQYYSRGLVDTSTGEWQAKIVVVGSQRFASYPCSRDAGYR